MVSRSLIAGLMSVGINIQNLEATAIPVARSVLPNWGWPEVFMCGYTPIAPTMFDRILRRTKASTFPRAKRRKLKGPTSRKICGDRPNSGNWDSYLSYPGG
jgi:mannose-1-phosphate guanylyltransferase/phosphomannomutase